MLLGISPALMLHGGSIEELFSLGSSVWTTNWQELIDFNGNYDFHLEDKQYSGYVKTKCTLSPIAFLLAASLFLWVGHFSQISKSSLL